MIRILSLILCIALGFTVMAQDEPMKIGVVGLVHTHVHGILGRADDGDFEIVGIAEPNRELALRYSERYGYSMDIVYSTIDDLLENTRPEAVTAFNTIRGHLEVVEKCAPLGIHVMVEKPLAVNLEHARKMVELARKNNIHLLTNYETTWYASNHEAFRLLEEEKAVFGDIRKIVVHDGHRGPIEIGTVDPEFLEWLTDPYYNGAGALTDFGCYGANLSTWLHRGEKPISVTAVVQQIKPDKYPEVDDEATIILTYPSAQTIIQASWNWPYNRKDMEVYSVNGYIHAHNGSDMTILRTEEEPAVKLEASSLQSPYNDAFSYFMAVIRGEVNPSPSDLSSLENNLTVMEILQAAMISAKEDRSVKISELK